MDNDCEIEFSQLPGRVFPVNLAKLGLSLVVRDASSPASCTTVAAKDATFSTTMSLIPPVSRLRYDETIDFPPALVVAYRVHEDSFMLDEMQGLSRMLSSGFQVLMEGIFPRTDLKAVLAAMSIQRRLGLSSKVGSMAKARAKTLARECLEDVLLARDTFRQLNGAVDTYETHSTQPCTSATPNEDRKSMNQATGIQSESSTTDDKLSIASRRITRLEKENERLMKALDEAYNQQRSRDHTRLVPPPLIAAPAPGTSPRPLTRSRQSLATGNVQ